MTDTSEDPFAVDERPLPTHYPEGTANPLAVIEADLRRLMRERAEAVQALEQDRQARERDKERLLLDLLEVLDAFERIFAGVKKKEHLVTDQMRRWLKNFGATRRLLQSILEHHGVQEMEQARGEFDPHWHEAQEVVADASVPEHQILRQEHKGYLRLGKVLRKAGVVVAGEPEEVEPEDEERSETDGSEDTDGK